jgi:outer membrane protein OmpA-like peptidoglycan-associated protein
MRPSPRLALVTLVAAALLLPGCAPGALLGGESCGASAGVGAIIGGTTGFILSRVLGASRGAQVAAVGTGAVLAGAVGYSQCRAARQQQRDLRARLEALEDDLAAERERAIAEIEAERGRAQEALAAARGQERDALTQRIAQLEDEGAEVEAAALPPRRSGGNDEGLVPGGGIVRNDAVVGVEERAGDEVSRRVFAYALDLSPTLTFRSRSAELRPAARRALQAVAGSINDQARRSVVAVVGHTDSVGPEDENQSLSERRARAVREVLLAHGVATQRVPTWATVGRGESELLVNPEITAADRRQNRRVQILILPEG